ncbi:cell division protein FtsL [Moraxella macacae 0408225]|uniref:Cell division protein FtsL n=1 Tax=Moraxella macacae 0408225 TaxID=1230338 RepID=L2FA50_9GAMM|nr:cell division protein FtsL [Moraxella macacae]ELA09348.1 cell division protein FtsL [Moraxella macacae 0408225]
MHKTQANSQPESIRTSFFDNVKGVVENFVKPKKNSTEVDKKTTAKKPSNEPGQNPKTVQNDIYEILQNDYQGISPYYVALLLLVIAILWTGTQVVEQVQDYHENYSKLQVLKKSFRQMQVERQRLLIEQQTFSATPQVTNRAVSELNMFYPNVSDRIVINNGAALKNNTTNNAKNNATTSTTQTIVIDPRTQH